MNVTYPGFGEIAVDNKVYNHDIVIEAGEVRARDKTPSKQLKPAHGHTPLSASETIPWSRPQLIIGSGYSGRLPVLPDVAEKAREQNVELVVLPTAEACRLLRDVADNEANAILHVTC